MSAIISYAQNREDIILNEFFKGRKDGFYVDVGANHPIRDSVTRLFYDKGWRGLNIEPSTKMFDLLKHDRPRDINVNVGVSNQPGRALLREYESTGYSTLAEEMKQEHSVKPKADTAKFKDREIDVDTLANILTKHGIGSIQFMKIDVEGFEYEVLEGNDWSKYRPEIICIEANHVYHDWRPILDAHGYIQAFSDGLNGYYVATEHRRLAEEFRFENILLGPAVVPWALQQEIKKRDEEIFAMRLRLEEEMMQYELLMEEKVELQSTIEHKRIRHQLRDLLRNVDKVVKARIENLRRTKPLQAAEQISLPLPRGASAKQLEAYARKLDFEPSSATPSFRLMTYWLVSGAYWLVRRMAKLIVKALRLVLALVRPMRKKQDAE